MLPTRLEIELGVIIDGSVLGDITAHAWMEV